MGGEVLGVGVPAGLAGEEVDDFELFFGDEAEPAVGEAGDASFAFVESSAVAVGVEVVEGCWGGGVEGEVTGGQSGPEPASVEEREGGDGGL